jgi:hypothetical protein
MSYAVSEKFGSNGKLFRNFFARDYLKDRDITHKQLMCAWEALEEDMCAVCVFIINIELIYY